MKTKMYNPSPALIPYVSSIMVLESDAGDQQTRLPFYADGCPGVMFAQTKNGVYLFPGNTKLDELILYGQTVHPIELVMEGAFRLVVFCLYSYITKPVFEINLSEIRDNCTNLEDQWSEIFPALKKTPGANRQVEIMSDHLLGLINKHHPDINPVIQQAIDIIIRKKGVVSIKQLRESLHVTERTFERYFAEHVGVSPKQFAQIIKFQTTLSRLTETDYQKLTDVVYENGFADQSHFIRTFKKYAGKTPGGFKG